MLPLFDTPCIYIYIIHIYIIIYLYLYILASFWLSALLTKSRLIVHPYKVPAVVILTHYLSARSFANAVLEYDCFEMNL